MSKILFVALMLMVPLAAQAAEKSPLFTLLGGLEVTAGYRWDWLDEQEGEASPSTQVHDPFFVGAQLRVPVGEYAGLFLSGDRDFVDAPRGNVRVGLYYRPFER